MDKKIKHFYSYLFHLIFPAGKNKNKLCSFQCKYSLYFPHGFTAIRIVSFVFRLKSRDVESVNGHMVYGSLMSQLKCQLECVMLVICHEVGITD